MDLNNSLVILLEIFLSIILSLTVIVLFVLSMPSENVIIVTKLHPTSKNK